MSNIAKQGGVSAAEGQSWMQHWSEKINPRTITLSGGEPTLNADIEAWIRNTRQCFPHSTIRVSSNGMHVKNVSLLPVLFEVGNAIYDVSMHLQGPTADLIVQEMLAQTADISADWHVMTMPGTAVPLTMTWRTVTVQMSKFDYFIKPYNGHGALMRPWRSSSKTASHAACAVPKNPFLHNNRLYKCSAIANLRESLKVMQLLDNSDWQQYLQYTGFGPDDDLAPFVQDLGTAHNICTMCNADGRAFVDHYTPAMVSIPITHVGT